MIITAFTALDILVLEIQIQFDKISYSSRRKSASGFPFPHNLET